MSPGERLAFCRTQAEAAHADLKTAVAQTLACGSERSCIKQGTCLGRPVCRVVGNIGTAAGYVVPEPESSENCGYCVSSFGGAMCFCPTRWALHRISKL